MYVCTVLQWFCMYVYVGVCIYVCTYLCMLFSFIIFQSVACTYVVCPSHIWTNGIKHQILNVLWEELNRLFMHVRFHTLRTYIHTYIHTCMHALHCIALDCIALHCIALHTYTTYIQATSKTFQTCCYLYVCPYVCTIAEVSTSQIRKSRIRQQILHVSVRTWIPCPCTFVYIHNVHACMRACIALHCKAIHTYITCIHIQATSKTLQTFLCLYACPIAAVPLFTTLKAI